MSTTLRQCFAERDIEAGEAGQYSGRWRCVLELGHHGQAGATGTDGAPFAYADGHRFEPRDTEGEPPKAKPKAPSEVVCQVIDGWVPAHTHAHQTETGHVWEWSTADGLWKIEYFPNFLGSIFKVGQATVAASGPGVAMTMPADDTGLGVIAATLGIVGAIDQVDEEANPDGL
mgnify:CR=1 FL=1